MNKSVEHLAYQCKRIRLFSHHHQFINSIRERKSDAK